jgi:hypothetical protein
LYNTKNLGHHHCHWLVPLAAVFSVNMMIVRISTIHRHDLSIPFIQHATTPIPSGPSAVEDETDTVSSTALSKADVISSNYCHQHHHAAEKELIELVVYP